jgi:adenylate kinase
MNLIFLGPPGAGKGTLAAVASQFYGIPHISTGEIFRAAIKNETELGKKVKGIIESGGLVPDELTIALVRERLAEKDAQKGWILDGFPRTIPQAEALEAIKAADFAVNFDIANEAVVERLSGRRVCKACGKNYHVKFQPTQKEGVCDACGGELFVREDDKPESIKKRLDVYRSQTEPLISFYREKKKLLDIDARPAPEKVMDEFKAAMQKRGK